MNPDLDVLSTIAPLLQVSPQIDRICSFGAQWQSDHEQLGGAWAMFHVMAEGSCVLKVRGSGTFVLGEGDVAVLPHGESHCLVSTHGAGDDPPPVKELGRTRDGLPIKGNDLRDPETRVVCGKMRFDPSVEPLVLLVLPPVIIFRANGGPDAADARALVFMMKEEFDRDRIGSTVVAGALAGVLMAITIRAHFENGETRPGLLGLISHPQTARVISEMLRSPSRDWTLQELAALSNMSRATLVRHFRRALGLAPLAFLSEIRLSFARRSVQRTHKSLALIAEESGYRSDASFSRAYHRRFGVAPGADRRMTGHAPKHHGSKRPSPTRGALAGAH